MTTSQKIIKYAALGLAALLTVTIIGGVMSTVIGIAGLFDGGKNMAGERKVYAVSQDIRKLELEIGAAELKIETGEYFQVESNLKNLKVEDRGGTLSVTEDNLFGINYNDVFVTLTLPAEYELQKASITTGAGRVSIQQLTAQSLELELGAGEVIIHALVATWEADIDTGAGRVTISDCSLKNLDLDMGVGRLELTAKLSGSCQIDQGVGEVQLQLMGSQDDYTISVKKGIGDIQIDGKSVKDDTTHGQGEANLRVNGGIGAAYITFID